MRARHEEQDSARNALDFVSREPLQEFSFQQVTTGHALTMTLERERHATA